MKIEYNEEELAAMIGRDLTHQGYSVKGKTITAKAYSKYLGKGKGTLSRVVATIEEASQSPSEALPSSGVPEVGVAASSPVESHTDAPRAHVNIFGDED